MIISKDYKICSSCVMDTSDPEITFNSENICNHCSAYKTYEAERLKGESTEKAISKMVDKIKKNSKGNSYNCIMGLSGGVDSSYLAWYAVKRLGLKPLVVHVDSGWNSELAVNNIESIINILGLDLHTLVVDWSEMRDLQRSFFKASVPNCDIPQDHSFLAGLYREASKYKIKSILNGGNMATESILPKAWGYSSTDLIFIKDIHSLFGEQNLKTYPTVNYWQKKIIYPFINSMKVYRPLEFIDYRKEEAKNLLMSEFGWRDYGGKHYESVFTKFFQAYYLPSKFGYDKRRAHLSSLIVSGQLLRENALMELNKPLYANESELESEITYITKKLGFSRKEWDGIMLLPNKTHLNYSNEIGLDNQIRKFIVKPISKIKSILKLF